MRGWVEFCPPDILTFSDEPAFVACCTRVRLNATGQFLVDLLATDAPGSNIDGTWTYRVTEELDCTDTPRTYYIELPQANTPVDLAEIAPTTRPPLLNYLRLPGPEGPAGQDADGTVAISTGTKYGGDILPSATTGAVDITAMTGYIVDEFTDPTAPVITTVQTPDQTVPIFPEGLAGGVFWFLVESDGTIVQQSPKPTAEQRRERIVLGAGVYNPDTEEVIVSPSSPTVLYQPMNQLADLAESLGTFVVRGLRLSPNGANLSLNLSAGQLFQYGFHHFTNDGQLTRSPHILPVAARTAFLFRMITREFAGTEPQVNVVDVANFDSNGTITAVGGSTNRSTVMRIWMVANGNIGNDIVVQYGQQTFASLADARSSIGGTAYVVDPAIQDNTTLLGHLAVIRSATSLSDPAQATFVRAGRFATP